MISVDFPAFGRPTIDTNPDLCPALALLFSTSLTASLMAGSHASPSLTAFVLSLATLSAGLLPALQIGIPAIRISRRQPERSRSHHSTNPQSSSPSRPRSRQNALPAYLPRPRSPCSRALPANCCRLAPSPVSNALHLPRSPQQSLPPNLPSWRCPQRCHAHQ